jgi:hypothetical protein
MKKLLIISLLILSGCAAQKTAVLTSFPDVPQDLLTACPDLKTVDTATEKLSEVLPIIVDNYSTYYECKVKVDTWVEWYNKQKEIQDSIK